MSFDLHNDVNTPDAPNRIIEDFSTPMKYVIKHAELSKSFSEPDLLFFKEKNEQLIKLSKSIRYNLYYVKGIFSHHHQTHKPVKYLLDYNAQLAEAKSIITELTSKYEDHAKIKLAEDGGSKSGKRSAKHTLEKLKDSKAKLDETPKLDTLNYARNDNSFFSLLNEYYNSKIGPDELRANSYKDFIKLIRERLNLLNHEETAEVLGIPPKTMQNIMIDADRPDYVTYKKISLKHTGMILSEKIMVVFLGDNSQGISQDIIDKYRELIEAAPAEEKAKLAGKLLESHLKRLGLFVSKFQGDFIKAESRIFDYIDDGMQNIKADTAIKLAHSIPFLTDDEKNEDGSIKKKGTKIQTAELFLGMTKILTPPELYASKPWKNKKEYFDEVQKHLLMGVNQLKKFLGFSRTHEEDKVAARSAVKICGKLGFVEGSELKKDFYDFLTSERSLDKENYNEYLSNMLNSPLQKDALASLRNILGLSTEATAKGMKVSRIFLSTFERNNMIPEGDIMARAYETYQIPPELQKKFKESFAQNGRQMVSRFKAREREPAGAFME